MDKVAVSQSALSPLSPGEPSTMMRNAAECVAGCITRQNCETLAYRQTLYHRFARNADGTAERCRVNGKVKTWKTRPNDFRVPVKHGLSGYSYITQQCSDAYSTVEPDYGY